MSEEATPTNSPEISQNPFSIDWKSEKYRDGKLTPTMRKCLKNLFYGVHDCHHRTLQALQWRGYCDKSGKLTSRARAIAIGMLPLMEQCKYLDIPLEIWGAPNTRRPENEVLKILQRKNKKAYFVENDFVTVINLILLGELVFWAKRCNKIIYSIDTTHYPDLFRHMRQDLTGILRRINSDLYHVNTTIFDNYFSENIYIGSIDYLFPIFSDVVSTFPINSLRSLAKMYLTNPKAYWKRGWPDIVVMEENNPHFIEVKTTDKLHLNQIITMPDLINWTNIPVKCVRLTSSPTTPG